MKLVHYIYDSTGQYLVVRHKRQDHTWKLEISYEHPNGIWRHVGTGRYATNHESATLDRLYNKRPD